MSSFSFSAQQSIVLSFKTDNKILYCIIWQKKMQKNKAIGHNLLRLAMDKGCTFFSQNICGETPLHIAALAGQGWIIYFAGTLFVNPNLRNDSGDTPLHYAFKYGNPEEVECLLRCGADRFIVNQSGELPTDFLRKSKHSATSAKRRISRMFYHSSYLDLVRRKKNLSSFKQSSLFDLDVDGMSLLHYAALFGNLSLVEQYLDLKETPEICKRKNVNGNTALHLITRIIPDKKDKSLFLFILRRMSMMTELSTLNYREETPLHCAVLAKNEIAARFLLERNCDVNSPSMFGETPLHYAVISRSESMIQLLIHFAANPNLVSKRPFSEPEKPLDLAIKSFQYHLLQLLVPSSSQYRPEPSFFHSSDSSSSYTSSRSLRTSSSSLSSALSPSTSSLSMTSSSSSTFSVLTLLENIISEKYHINGIIQEGQETVVYRVTHRRRGKELAAKIQVAPQSEDLSLSNRSHETLNEKCDSKEKYARLLNCPHPNLVRYRGFFDSPHFCVIMDYLAIGSLGAIRKSVTFTETELWYIAESILKALYYLHHSDFVHGNIKPENVLVSSKGNVQLADYAIIPSQFRGSHPIQVLCEGAKVEIDLGERLSNMQPVDGFLFLAPELLKLLLANQKSFSLKTVHDIWSFGVLICSLADGFVPHSHSANLEQAAHQIVEGPSPGLSTKRWSRDICQFLELCCHKEPSSRRKISKLLLHKNFRSAQKEKKKISPSEGIIHRYQSSWSELSGQKIYEKESEEKESAVCGEFVDVEKRLEKLEKKFRGGDSSSGNRTPGTPGGTSGNRTPVTLGGNSGSRTSGNRTPSGTPPTSPASSPTSSPNFGLILRTHNSPHRRSPPGPCLSFSMALEGEESNFNLIRAKSGSSTKQYRKRPKGLGSILMKKKWTLWVKVGDRDSIPLENIDPFSTIHSLKDHIKSHDELEDMRVISSKQIRLSKNHEGKSLALEPQETVAQVLSDGSMLQVKILVDSVLSERVLSSVDVGCVGLKKEYKKEKIGMG
mmetsp:Transcript_15046/g.21082  ORF Transcript_15046/g.21082 Transcript_15046/m.21082 type:complete len:1004 (+) Transcript_15046:307-3318(+)